MRAAGRGVVGTLKLAFNNTGESFDVAIAK